MATCLSNFQLLRYQPRTWQAADSLLIGLHMFRIAAFLESLEERVRFVRVHQFERLQAKQSVNCIEAAIASASGSTIHLQHLPRRFQGSQAPVTVLE